MSRAPATKPAIACQRSVTAVPLVCTQREVHLPRYEANEGAVTDLLAAMRPEPKRDRYGRYLLPDPDTGKNLARQRVTTFAHLIEDSYNIGQWETRMSLKGLAMRPDLIARVASTDVSRKDELNKLAAQAKEAASSSAAANTGTALHAFSEQVDRGEDPKIPPPWDADIAAYKTAMDTAGIIRRAEWIERIVITPQLGLAGTFDRILELPSGDLIIGDVKSGKDLSYAWLSISVQLAVYAHAIGMWDWEDGYEAMPPVRQDYGMVMHIPAGTGTCDLYLLDLTAGWQAAHECAAIRMWRARKDLASPWEGALPGDDDAYGLLAMAIDEAQTTDDLTALWRQGTQEGLWSPELTVRAAARKNYLTKDEE